MPPHFCTSASDIVADTTGSIAGFRFLGWLVVEIECDDGTIGIGNAALAPHATKTTIDTYLKPLLIGTDPLDSEYLWQSHVPPHPALRPQGHRHDGDQRRRPRDLGRQGQDPRQPVFKLLGGRTKAKLPVYASRLYSQPLDTLYARGEGLCGAGYSAVKIRFGWGPKDGVAGINKNLDLVRTAREAIGPTSTSWPTATWAGRSNMPSACCARWRPSISAGSRSR